MRIKVNRRWAGAQRALENSRQHFRHEEKIQGFLSNEGISERIMDIKGSRQSNASMYLYGL